MDHDQPLWQEGIDMDGGQIMDDQKTTKLGRPPRATRPTRHISFDQEVLDAANKVAKKGLSDFMNEAAREHLRRKYGVKIT
jgi:hypothetical protein